MLFLRRYECYYYGMIRRRLGVVVGMFVLVAMPLLVNIVQPTSMAAAAPIAPPPENSTYSLVAVRVDAAHIQVTGTGTTDVNGTTLDMNTASGMYYDNNLGSFDATSQASVFKLGGDKQTGVPKGCKQSSVGDNNGGNTESVDYDLFLSQIGANSQNCVEFKLASQPIVDTGLGFDLNAGLNPSDIKSSIKGIYISDPSFGPTNYSYVTYFLQDSTTIYASDGDPAYDKDSNDINNYLFKQAANGNFERQSGGHGGHGCSDLIEITQPGGSVDQATYTTRNQASDGRCTPYQTFQIALLTSSPQSQAGPGANGGSNTSGGSSNDCGITNELAWVVCPILYGLNWLTSELDGVMGSLLTLNTDQIFNTSGEYYQAWSNIRNLAMGLIVISAVIAIGAEALGFEIISAYAFRTIASRLFLAIIFMVFAWPILEVIVTFFNNMGNWASDIMSQPFSGLQDFSYSSTVSQALGLTAGIGVGAVAGVAAWWGVGGFAGLLSLVGTAALGLSIGFATLVIRDMIVILALLASPVFIGAEVLPGTRKLAAFGKDTFFTALAMFPIVEIFVSSGKIVAKVEEASSANAFLKAAVVVIAYVVPYFLLPLAFRMAGGLVSTVTGMVNDRSRGGFDRLRGIREGSRAKMHQQRMNDTHATNALTRGVNSAYRRVVMAGEGGLSVRGRRRQQYAAAQRKHRNAVSNEVLESDEGRIAGDDNATTLAMQEGMTRGRFVTGYAQRIQALAASRGETLSDNDARGEAQRTLADMEGSFGARIGSEAMQVAAFKARAASVTGYAGNDAGLAELMTDARRMYQSGLLTRTDTAMAIKANKTRSDQAGVGMGVLLSQIGQQGPVTHADIEAMRDNAAINAQPGALASQRPEAVEALAPTIYRNLNRAADNVRAAGAGTPERAAAVRDFKQQMAHVAGLHDTMSQIAPQNANILADGVLGQELQVGDIPELQQYLGTNNVTGRVTVQSMIDGGDLIDGAGAPVTQTHTDSAGNVVTTRAQSPGLRADSHFKENRRDYGQLAAAQAAAAAGGLGGPGGPGGPMLGSP